MDQKAYINAMWIMFPNSTLQKHGTGRSGGPGRDRCDENQPGFIWVAVGIRNPGDCCFDSGPCSAESRLRLETIHRVAATSVTRPTRHFLKKRQGTALRLIFALPFGVTAACPFCRLFTERILSSRTYSRNWHRLKRFY